MKRHHLGRKALCGLTILAMILIVCICLTVGSQYLEERTGEYNRLAFSYARTIADYIDGDRVLTYIETNTEDDYYRQIQDLLNTTQKQADLKYYYVFVPYEEDLVYVWDADNVEGARTLGYHEEYIEGGKKAVIEIFRQNPPEKISVTQSESYGYIASAYSPIFNSAGEPIAVVGVDLSMMGIEESLYGFLLLIIISVFGVIIISTGLFYIFMRKNIITPINLLNEAAKNMVSNLEEENIFQVDIHTGDEIEELSRSFLQMNVELRDYIRQLSTVTAEKERIGAELDIATHIQSSMLPRLFPAFPDRKEFDIYATMNPAKEVGGDFYDFFLVDERHLAVVMADVSGKGVPAALFMVIGKTLIKDHTQPGIPVGDVFFNVNNLLCNSNSEGMFITAFEGVLDLVTGKFSYVNAGHEAPYICRRGQSFEAYEVKLGFVLAGMEDIRYKEGSMQLEPGDKIFLYTDGVPEATNAHNELYGNKRLNDSLNKNRDRTLKELLFAVKADVDSFVAEAPQFDDITMLALEYTASS